MFTRAVSGILMLLIAAVPGCRRSPAQLESDIKDASLPEPSSSAVPDTPASVPGAVAPCPAEMAWIPPGFCMDRWEAALVEEDGKPHSPYHPAGTGKVRAISRAGLVPQAHISAEEAGLACERSGKALCSTKQWVEACMGTQKPGRVWPFGGEYRKGACNDNTGRHPVDRLLPGTGRKRDATTLNDPRINQQPGTLAPTGSHPECVTPEGVHDLVGNLLEWTRDPRPLLMGGHYVDATENGKGCTYVTMLHDEKYADYTTGFRCCLVPAKATDAGGAPASPSSAERGHFRSFDDPSAPLPPGPGPAAYATGDAPCPQGMVLVEGERCTLVRQDCLRWADPPGGVPQRTCAEFASPTVCEGARRKMRFCIDRLEYTPPGFELPLVHVSMTEAENVCAAQGKRLCDELEWEFACEGPEALPYPYGHVRDGSRCNHDVGGLLFPGGKLADRRVPSSSLERCVSPFGVQSLVGNVDEWCVRPGASPRSVLRGGWWLTGRNRCRAVTDSHGENYAGPQTGFRCCKASR